MTTNQQPKIYDQYELFEFFNDELRTFHKECSQINALYDKFIEDIKNWDRQTDLKHINDSRKNIIDIQIERYSHHLLNKYNLIISDIYQYREKQLGKIITNFTSKTITDDVRKSYKSRSPIKR
jgi:hypothetical protein